MNAIETGLYTALNVAAVTTELGGAYIYKQVAPQGRARPYIIFQHTGGGHWNMTPSDLQGHVYLVKGVSENQKQAGDIDDDIRGVLHNATLTIAGYTNFDTQREEQVRYVETLDSGKLVYHAGAYYRIRIDA